MSKTIRISVAILPLLLIALPVRADDRGRPFRGRFARVTADHYALHPTGEEFYLEEYDLLAWNEAGDRINIGFAVSNLGFGDMRAKVQARVQWKGGKQARGSTERDEDDWSHRARPFRMVLGGSRLSGGPGKLRAVVKEGGVDLDLTFENVLPPWRPGNGRATYDEDGEEYYDLTLLAPRAKVTGTVKAAGRTVSFSGTGYADHRASNVAPNVAGRRWVRFRAFDGDWTVVMQEFHFPRDLGGGRSPFLLVGYRDGIVFQSLGYRLRFTEVGRDKNPDTPYKYPKAMALRAKAGGRTVEATVKGYGMARSDLLAGLGRVQRAVLSRIVRPVGYYFDADFDLKVVAGEGEAWETSGKGTYYIKHVTR